MKTHYPEFSVLTDIGVDIFGNDPLACDTIVRVIKDRIVK
jgi:hypothetical protein